MKKMQPKNQAASNMLLGMAAGAAVSAAGMYYASMNQREAKRMAKKISHRAENAVSNLDKMMTNITRNF